MGQKILREKFFTIIFSIFYVLAIISVFYSIEKIIVFLIFIIASLLVIFAQYGLRRCLILIFIFLLGIIRANQDSPKPSVLDNLSAKNVLVEGRIVSSKQITNQNSKIKFYLDVKNMEFDSSEINNKNSYSNIDSRILVNLDYDEQVKDRIIIGDYISLLGNLKPAYHSTNPYQFDYKNYLLNNDCVNILYSKSSSFKVIKEAKLSKDLREDWYYILKKFELLRIEIIKKHAQNIKSPRLEILAGLVFGNETISPDDKIKESFRNSGLLHLLAASGLNVALIYGIWWWIASLVRLPYNFSVFTGAFFVILYTFMTGFPPSILRASIMLLFVLFGKLIDRTISSTALIFFVGFLILLFSPKMFFDIGFELSFAVTFGLIVCCPVIIESFSEIDKKYKEKFSNFSSSNSNDSSNLINLINSSDLINLVKKQIINLFSPKSLVSIICVPLVAQMWVIPLQLHYFNTLAPLSILANIAVVPFIGILGFIGFLSSILALVPKISNFIVFIFDYIANPLLALLINISDFFASFKYSLLNLCGFNAFQIFAFWGLILLFIVYIKKKFERKYLNIFLCFLIIFLLSLIKIDSIYSNLEIMAFDVGNADCFLIRTPNKKYIMIDSGKKFYKGSDDAQIIINPYLRNKRIKTIDYLILTHFDLDHCGGALTLLKNYNVKHIILNSINPKSKSSRELIEYIKENKLNYTISQNNKTILEENGLRVTTFNPKIAENNHNKNYNQRGYYDKENEQSTITYLQYKDKSALFMADCGIMGFSKVKDLIKKTMEDNNVDNIDILKTGHHGAKNTLNEEILNILKPQYTIISTGINNFNHPSYETIELLDKFNSTIISTKEQGFVKIQIKNKSNSKISKNSKESNVSAVTKLSFHHFNCETKKLEKLDLDSIDITPFNKRQFYKNFLKNNINQENN